jgi:hypothetical protein
MAHLCRLLVKSGSEEEVQRKFRLSGDHAIPEGL